MRSKSTGDLCLRLRGPDPVYGHVTPACPIWHADIKMVVGEPRARHVLGGKRVVACLPASCDIVKGAKVLDFLCVRLGLGSAIHVVQVLIERPVVNAGAVRVRADLSQTRGRLWLELSCMV